MPLLLDIVGAVKWHSEFLISSLTSCSNEIIVMHEPSNTEITKEKLECLRPRGWLNDEVNNYTECLFIIKIKYIE